MRKREKSGAAGLICKMTQQVCWGPGNRISLHVRYLDIHFMHLKDAAKERELRHVSLVSLFVSIDIVAYNEYGSDVSIERSQSKHAVHSISYEPEASAREEQNKEKKKSRNAFVKV